MINLLLNFIIKYIVTKIVFSDSLFKQIRCNCLYSRMKDLFERRKLNTENQTNCLINKYRFLLCLIELV